LIQSGLLTLPPHGRAATKATYLVLGMPVSVLVNGMFR